MKIKWEDWTPSGPDGITVRHGTFGLQGITLRVRPSSVDGLWTAIVLAGGGEISRRDSLRTQDEAKRVAVRLANRAVESKS